MRRNSSDSAASPLPYAVGLILGALSVVVGCHARPQPGNLGAPIAASESTTTGGPRASSALDDAAEGEPLVAFLGDSITAGLHLARDAAYPAVLERELRETGTPLRVLNAGVSGDTTAGGRTRVDWILRQRPSVLVVELGANDGLRGLPIEVMRDNLRAIVTAALEADTRVLLLGMRLPPNYGEPYASRFAAVYDDLAKELSVPLVPFFMRGVAGMPDLNLPDGIHPTAEGHEALARNVAPALRAILEELTDHERAGR